MDKSKLLQGAELIVQGLGLEDEELIANTPHRYVKALLEIFNPDSPTSLKSFNESFDGYVYVDGHVNTLCPHHLLPVKMHVNALYKPNGSVLGASKLIRVFQIHNTKPMTQEDLTKKALDHLIGATRSEEVAVLIVGRHDCMAMRGVKSSGVMRTSASIGIPNAVELFNSFQSLK